MSDDNVVGMPGIARAHPPGRQVDDVVELLEDWLERARSGDLIQVVIGGVTAGGKTSTNWIGKAEHYQTVYVSTILQARIIQASLNFTEPV